jgi:endo-1,3(4)-beta-glucanase
VSGGSSGNQGASRYYTHEIVRELQFSAMEFNAKPIFEVTDWTDLGVSMYLKPQSKGQGEIQSNLVSGMAYITSKYILLTPKLTTSASITHINGVSTESQREVEGSTLKLTLSNGQTWVLYGLSMDGTRSQILRFRLTDQNASTLESDTVFNGILRVALIMKEEQDKVLDQYKHCIVTGANVNIENDTTSYAFKFQTEGSCTQQGLLHYAMQHQVTSIDQQSAFQIQDMVANSTTRGPLQAYVTSTNTTFTGNTTWQLNIPKENQVPVSFYPMNSPNITLVKKYHLLDQLKKDIEAEWSLPFDGSFYFNGKAAQKYASLCLIANDIKITGNEQNILLKKCTEKLRQVLQNYIYNQWKYPLLYDLLYKGLISSEGIITRNVYADFGNTMYNDHHYHYGYWIHTSAVMNQLDPTWEFLPQLNQMTNLLIRDVASCGRDLYFPSYRHFDWYRGHSFSHGITSSMDGKNEESISEDINFSNSLMLYGKVLNNPRLYINGKIMASIQVETINKYFLFHLDDDDKNHPLPPPPPPSPPHLLKQNQVTGILFENKIIYTTWFSNEKFCIHGIQMLPMISLSFVYRTKNFIQQEWNDILSKEQIVLQNDFKNPWLSILYVNYARINQEKAMNILQKTQMDDGLSKSWALYLATFPS